MGIRNFLKILMVVVGLMLIGTTLASLALFKPALRYGKPWIEMELGRYVNAAVRIESVQPMLERGALELTGVQVDNPGGFPGGPALRFARIELTPKMNTLFSGTILWRLIRLEGGVAWLHESAAGNNLDQMAAQASALAEAEAVRHDGLFRRDWAVEQITVAPPLVKNVGANGEASILEGFSIVPAGAPKAVRPATVAATLLKQLARRMAVQPAPLAPMEPPAEPGGK